MLTCFGSFVLGVISLVLPFGQLYSMFKAKTLYYSSLILFYTGSAIYSAGDFLNTFIVGRVIAGLGGTGIYLGVMTLLSASTTDTKRLIYLGLIGLVFSVGNVLGPIIRGALSYRLEYNLALGLLY